MEKFKLVSAKLTGTPGSSGWAQVHEFAPEEPEKLKSHGRLFAVIATSKPQEGVDSVVAGRELLARLHEEYFGKEGGSSFNTLKAAVEKITGEFKDSWGHVEIAAVTAMDGVVYSAVGGGAQVSIFRNAGLANILESGDEVVSASGYPQEGDVLILGTKFFFDTLSAGVIKGALEGKGLAEAVESLAPSVHGGVDMGSLGAVLVKFEKGEKILPEVSPESAKDSSEKIAAKEPSSIQKKLEEFSNLITQRLEFLAKRLPERRIYIKGAEGEEVVNEKKRMTVSVGAILLVLLLVSIGFGIRQKSLKESRAGYEDRLSQAQHELDEAVSLASLNPERARELFVASRTVAVSLKDEGVKDDRLEALITKIEQRRGEVLGEYEATPQLYLDLSILSDGLFGDDLSSSVERMFILDRKGRKVVGVAFATKKTEILAGPEQVGEAQQIAGYEDRVFVLADDGIYEVGTERDRVLDKNWEEALIYAYAANIYVLDKGSSAVYRYPGIEDGFGSQQEWLGAGVAPDFSSVVALTIDGAVWTISDSGRAQKYSLGSPQAIDTSGVFPELTSATSIYTNEESGFVYILDRVSKRVVVLEKDGKYKAQYIAETIGEATGLAVSEETKTLILLAGSKLYSIDLKHL